jgi:hypothetical protein
MNLAASIAPHSSLGLVVVRSLAMHPNQLCSLELFQPLDQDKRLGQNLKELLAHQVHLLEVLEC